MAATETTPPPEVGELLNSVRNRGQEIDRLAAHLAELEEDGVHRYYAHSCEVFRLQHAVRACRSLLASLAPDGAHLDPSFVAICRDACAHQLRAQLDGENWRVSIRPILEGFWHCSDFVRMLSRFGRQPKEPPGRPPSGWAPPGWAAVLALYGLQ